MKTTGNLSAEQYRDMLQMLKDLTPKERASLADPDFITEDEADIIVSNRRANEPGRRISADQLFAEVGYKPRSRKV
jgi:hypothetical protein